jgi:hypothetical protein
VKVNGKISVEYKIDDKLIYQIIRILPEKQMDLKYMMEERYKIGRDVSDFLSKIYIGNGSTICFEDKKHFKNSTTIVYRLETDEIPILKNEEFRISGEKPQFNGCKECTYYKKGRGKARCDFRKKFIEEEKKYCQDFYEGDNIE